jgi:hypothetical protein
MRFDDKDITAKIQEQIYSYLSFSEGGGISSLTSYEHMPIMVQKE